MGSPVFFKSCKLLLRTLLSESLVLKRRLFLFQMPSLTRSLTVWNILTLLIDQVFKMLVAKKILPERVWKVVSWRVLFFIWKLMFHISLLWIASDLVWNPIIAFNERLTVLHRLRHLSALTLKHPYIRYALPRLLRLILRLLIMSHSSLLNLLLSVSWRLVRIPLLAHHSQSVTWPHLIPLPVKVGAVKAQTELVLDAVVGVKLDFFPDVWRLVFWMNSKFLVLDSVIVPLLIKKLFFFNRALRAAAKPREWRPAQVLRLLIDEVSVVSIFFHSNN